MRNNNNTLKLFVYPGLLFPFLGRVPTSKPGQPATRWNAGLPSHQWARVVFKYLNQGRTGGRGFESRGGAWDCTRSALMWQRYPRLVCHSSLINSNQVQMYVHCPVVAGPRLPRVMLRFARTACIPHGHDTPAHGKME